MAKKKKQEDDCCAKEVIAIVLGCMLLVGGFIYAIERATAPEKFSWPDCVDDADWVTEDRDLNGNMFYKVDSIGPTLGGNYLVKECVIADDRSSVTCGPIESKNLYNYEKITCPKTY